MMNTNRRRDTILALVLGAFLGACAAPSSAIAAGAGAVEDVVKQLLDTLGITTAGVYTPPGGGWTDNGTTVTTATATDGVGIGAAAPNSTDILRVTGDATRKHLWFTTGPLGAINFEGVDVSCDVTDDIDFTCDDNLTFQGADVVIEGSATLLVGTASIPPRMRGGATLDEMAAPSTPASGRVALYAKSDGLLYSKDDAGVETLVSGGSAGGLPVAAETLSGSRTLTTSDEILYLDPNGADRDVVLPAGVSAGTRFMIHNTAALDATFYVLHVLDVTTWQTSVCRGEWVEAVYDGAAWQFSDSAGGRHTGAFTPTAYYTRTLLWINPNNGLVYSDTSGTTLSVTDGTAVASIRDQSKTRRLLTQSTAGTRPTLKTNIVNGKSVLRFDGGDELISSVLIHYSGSSRVFIVAALSSWSAADYRAFFGSAYSTTTGMGFLKTGTSVNGWAQHDLVAFGSGYDVNGRPRTFGGSGAVNGYSANSFHLFHAPLGENTAINEGSFNNTISTTSVSGPGQCAAPGSGNLLLGASTSGNDRLLGDIAELLVMGEGTTDEMAYRIHRYMRLGFGL